jgi:MYXO-CTERM domain-containing protein
MLASNSASAAWSIVSVDAATGEVGIAGASCEPGISTIAGVVPGKGVIAAQGVFYQPGRDLGVMMLKQDKTAQQILDALTLFKFDPAYQTRQYGVATLHNDALAFTGDETLAWAGDVQSDQTPVVSLQGTLLADGQVIDAGLSAFGATHDCPFDLADRLMDALEAGIAPGGDARCSNGQSALSAFIIVAKGDDVAPTFYLNLASADQNSGGDDAVAKLREAFDAWRLTHPADDSECDDTGTGDDSSDTSSESSSTSSTNESSSDTGSTDTGSNSSSESNSTSASTSSNDTSSTSTSGSDSTSASDTSSDSTSTTTTTSSDTSSTGDESGDGSGTHGEENTDDSMTGDTGTDDEEDGAGDGGCSCAVGNDTKPWLGAAFFAILAGTLRRRRRG